jgi:hypothetical protein
MRHLKSSPWPGQQAVVALPWRIDGLLIDQNGVDHAAHLDELLPIPAVASEARDLTGANRTNLAEANLRHHPLKASALYSAGDRSASGSPTPPDRSCNESQKIAALGNNLNADNDQYGGEKAKMVREVIANGNQKKNDKDDDQEIQAKDQACGKS